MEKFIIFILLVFNSIVFSQNNLKTNIDTNFLIPKWSISNLNVIKFKNGDSIIYVDENTPISSITTKSAYTTKKINGIEYYFYNWNAVQDPRGLAPNGYKIASAEDYKKLRSNNTIFRPRNGSKNSFTNLISHPKNIFYFDTIGNFEGEYSQSNDNQFFWVKSEDVEEYKSAAQFSFDEDLGNYVLGIYAKNYEFALPVKCVQDLNTILKDRIFPYDSLMPNQTNHLINSLKQTLILSFNHDVRVDLNGKIEFGSNGLNKSKLNTLKISSGSDSELSALSKKIDLKLLSLETPIYQGNYLLAQKNLAIDFAITQTKKRDQGFYSYNFFAENKVSTELSNNMLWAIDKKFKYIKSTKNITFTINGELISEPNKNYITRFIPLGPIYSFYSLIPGGGILKVDQTRKHYPGAKMIHFSIPIGTIALGSFLYSNYQYNNYKSSLDPSVFSRANMMHKVFLSTLTTYAILGVIDFTRSFLKGIDNVKLARKINKEIKEKHNGGLLF